MLKSVVYYTDLHLPEDLRFFCSQQLMEAARGLEIVTVGLNAPAGFGEQVVLRGERGVLMMLKQILAGLERATGECVFLCEHDVYYSPTHFDFTPSDPSTFYYNVNVQHVRWNDGLAVQWDDCQQVSGLCAARALLLDFYKARIAQVQQDGFNRHYEPGLKQTVGGQKVENRHSRLPNLDIRHGGNLTPSKWSPADFRNPHNARGFTELGLVEFARD